MVQMLRHLVDRKLPPKAIRLLKKGGGLRFFIKQELQALEKRKKE
jgi:hypothetical protein